MLTKCYDKPICENSLVASTRTIRRAHVSPLRHFLVSTCSRAFSVSTISSKGVISETTGKYSPKTKSLARKYSDSGSCCFGLWGIKHFQDLSDTITSIKSGGRLMHSPCHSCRQLIYSSRWSWKLFLNAYIE